MGGAGEWASISSSSVLLFSLLVLLAFALLFGLFFFGWWITQKERSLSPYTGLPLRRADTLSYYSMEKVLRYLYELHQYDNRIFAFRRSAVCRETGRIFQDCIGWFDQIVLDWSFIQKRFPGSFVSWGSLTREQQEEVRLYHDSLEGFQTEFSSTNPLPKAVEPLFAYTKPGPLYVDFHTKVLLGWKCVPGTELEVLIVKKPKNSP